MALIQCPECGKEISNKAEKCPNCGFPMENRKQDDKDYCEISQEEIKNKEKTIKEIYEMDNASTVWVVFCVISVVFLIGTMANESVGGIIISLALSVLFYALAKDCKNKSKKIQEVNGILNEEVDEYKEKIKNENIGKAKEQIANKKMSCPCCGGYNIKINIETIGEKTKGNTEKRKKSYITRKANKKARRGMVIATGGLWALTPKKSEYKDVTKMKTTYEMKKVGICQDCGNVWNIL